MKELAYVFAGSLLCTAAFGFPAGAAFSSVDQQSQRVIRQSRVAMGISAVRGVRVVRLDENVKTAGLSGTQTQWIDLASLRLAEFAKLPPLRQDDGYDGRVAWNRDASGVVWNDGSDAGRSTAISNAYVSAYGLWKPNAAGARVTYAGIKTEKGRSYDVLEVLVPRSKLPVDLWFDRATHLLARERFAIGPIVNTVDFSAYRRVRGTMIPYRVHADTTSGNSSDAVVTAVAFDPPGGMEHVRRPQPAVHDFSMQNGATSSTVPFTNVQNHVYLDVMLNGKGPYHMIFDTGGSNVIDPAVAAEIGAVGKGNLQGMGVGAKTESFSFAKVDTLMVGDAILRDQIFAVLPVRAGFGISAGRAADGLIGWEVLARYVITFDYANNRVVLMTPGSATLPAGAHIVPFVFSGTQPQVACAIDNIPSECTIDTGARDTMTLYGPYIAAHPDVKPANVSANGVTGFGVGGPAFGQLGRIASFSLADFTLHGLIADFSTQTQGAFASPFVAANLGGNLLRRFNVTFDYAHEKMALVPNATFSERDTHERSGLFVVNDGGKVTVVDVRPGTPAADAGIVKGDVITSIDGTPTTGMTLDDVRAYFAKAAGTVLSLELRNKAGDARTVAVTLSDYI